MKYYSTNRQERNVSLEEAVVKGLAADKGLYMPDTIKSLPASFYDHIEELSFQEIACGRRFLWRRRAYRHLESDCL